MTRWLRRIRLHPGIIPVVVLLGIWWLLPQVIQAPAYKLPRLQQVVRTFWELLTGGVLLDQTVNSLIRLAEGCLIGAGLGLLLGFGLASSRRLAAFLEPVLVFFQAIAGIAWVPLAIIWFGFGPAPVVFVVANGIFFIVLLNTSLGVQTIPPVLRNAVRTLGGDRLAVLREVVVPGALANVITGLRLGLGFGWKALVASEIIAGGKGLGYMAAEASQRYESPTIIVSIGLIGLIWLLIDRWLLRPLETHTVERWGIIQRAAL